jgi:hypothetical protein
VRRGLRRDGGQDVGAVLDGGGDVAADDVPVAAGRAGRHGMILIERCVDNRGHDISCYLVGLGP